MNGTAQACFADHSMGKCTLQSHTFLVPVHSLCKIQRIGQGISIAWNYFLGQNNLLVVGVNHLLEMVNKFHFYFHYTCRKEFLNLKHSARPGVKVYVFFALLGPPLHF